MFSDDHPDRRNALLRVGAAILNIFALAFALDAGVLIAQAAGVAGLGTLREISFALNATMAGAALMTVILVPHLPKVILAPLALYMGLCFLGLPAPFDGWTESAQAALYAAAMGLAAVATYAAILWRMGSPIIRAADLPFREVWTIRTVFAAVALIAGTTVMTMGGYLWAIGALLEQQAGGYLDFTWSDLRVREDVFEKDGRRVYLIGMIHIGEPKFYATIKKDMPADALFLTEGVSDRKELMTGGLDYRKAARVLGLEAQPAFKPKSETPDDETEDAKDADPSIEPPLAPSPQGQTFRRADLDVSDFDPRTVKLLGKIGSLYSGGDAVTFLVRFVQFATALSGEDYAVMQGDILKKRNEHLLMELDNVPAAYRSVVMPWGAAHLPGVVEGLKARGYVMTETRHRVVARYSTVLFRRFGTE